MRVVFDISSVVWDEEAFKIDSTPFYAIAEGANKLFPILEDRRADVLLRDELAAQILMAFPISSPPRHFKDLQQVFYRFLWDSQATFISYSGNRNNALSAVPDLKLAYAPELDDEVDFLVSKLYLDGNTSVVYLTLEGCWDGITANLIIRNGAVDKSEFRTIVADKGDDLPDFFDSLKKVFEHKEKHDRVKGHKTNKGEVASPLSCFDGDDPSYVQSLLDEAEEDGNYHYKYDEVNNVWVIFRQKSGNRYYGYDALSESEIPDRLL